jgi:hypothetical protein
MWKKYAIHVQMQAKNNHFFLLLDEISITGEHAWLFFIESRKSGETLEQVPLNDSGQCAYTQKVYDLRMLWWC